MKIVFTAAGRRDLDDILSYLTENNPTLVEPVSQRIQATLAVLSQWPQSARSVAQRAGVRVASLIHHPYQIFYRVDRGVIEIIHIRHTSRHPWTEDS